MQDRILGPLTMVQFLYAVVGGGFCYAIYMTPIPKTIALVFIAPIALITAALVFIKVNERPFLDFLISMLEFLSTPKQRVWRHENLPDLKVEIYQVKKSNEPIVQSKRYSHQDIANLAKNLDQGNFERK